MGGSIPLWVPEQHRQKPLATEANSLLKRSSYWFSLGPWSRCVRDPAIARERSGRRLGNSQRLLIVELSCLLANCWNGPSPNSDLRLVRITGSCGNQHSAERTIGRHIQGS
jgi:hypothetical protein